MPPKRAASRSRAAKEEVSTGDNIEQVETVAKKGGRSAKAANVKTKTPPPPPEVEAETKSKSRGRPKKKEEVKVDEPIAVKTPVKNARSKKVKQVVEEVQDPVEVPKNKRSRKPVVEDVPEPAPKVTKGARSRSSSKTPVKKSPAKKAPRAKSPAKKESKAKAPVMRAKSPEKKTSRAKSPVKKVAKDKSPVKKAPKSPAKKATKLPVMKAGKASGGRSKSRSKIVEPEPDELDDVHEEPEEVSVPEKATDTETIQQIEEEPAKVVPPPKRGRKAVKAEPAKPVERSERLGRRGRGNKEKTPEENETEKNVQTQENAVEEMDQSAPQTTEEEETKEVLDAKPKGRARKAPATAVEPRVSKPRGRPKATEVVPDVKEPLEPIPEDSLITLAESAPAVPSNELKVDEPLKATNENHSEVEPDKEKMEDEIAESNIKDVEKPSSSEETGTKPMDVVEEDAQRASKRKLSEEPVVEEIQTKKAKTQKLPVVQLPKVVGRLMTCGTDSTGELGLRNLGVEKRRPVPVTSVTEPVCLVTAGAMHTVAVDVGGTKIYTFGCNDELALGRKTTASNGTSGPNDPDATLVTHEDIPEAVPTAFTLPNNIVKVTAGDSHTAALTEFGALYAWGCFRDNRGRVGLIADGKPKNPIGNPVNVMPFETTVVDIASGDNHVIALTENGTVYSFGVGEQGQLGRIPEPECKINEDYSNLDRFLKPQMVTIDGNPDIKCDRVWAAGFTSFVRTTDGAIYGWGLNNYSQLGFKSEAPVIVEAAPKKLASFCDSVESITGGLHHTLALDSNGKVYSWGKHLYGRLGHPDLTADVESPKMIEELKDEKVTQIACGNDCSFAVTESGNLYSWGMFAVHLGHVQRDEDTEEDDKDVKIPRKVTGSKLTNTSFYAVASGSQHAVFIASGEHQNGN